MKRAWIFSFCVFFLHFSNISASAQATSRVTGTVVDTSGAEVAGAQVTLTNEATNISVNTTTTSTGADVFEGTAPGSYKISIAAQGFATFTSKENVLTIAQPMVVNASLHVGQASEQVEVTAGAELVQILGEPRCANRSAGPRIADRQC